MVKLRTMSRSRFTSKTRVLDRVKLNISLLSAEGDYAPLYATLVFLRAVGDGMEYTVTVDGKSHVSKHGRAEVLVERGAEVSYVISADGYQSVSGVVIAEDVNLDILMSRFVADGTSETPVCPCPCNERVITIEALPGDALINLGNKYEGSGSVSGKFLKGTTVAYEVSAEGYATQSGSLVVDGDQTVQITLSKSVVVEVVGGTTNFTEDVTVEGGLDLSAATASTTLQSGSTAITVSSDITSPYCLILASTDGGDLAVKGSASSPVVIAGSQPKANGNASVSINTSGAVVLSDIEFSKEVAYNAIEIGINGRNGVPKSVLIENVDFTKSLLNNAILIHATQDNAEIIIRNVHFGSVSNAVRFSNMTAATGVKVLFENCTVDSWDESKDSLNPAFTYAGFLLMQDFTSVNAAEAASVHRFGPECFEVTFRNCVGPHGLINFSGRVADGAPSVSGSPEDQSYYSYYNKGFGVADNVMPAYEESSWPVFKFE